jgi:thymidylate synthase (FAD)
MMTKHDPLGDGISYVEYITHSGSDLLIVNAARVSHHKHHDEFDGESDGRLLQYLLKHKHWTPFAHPQITLRIKMPIFLARQWYRHTIGIVRNEVSRRYVEDTPEFFFPEVFHNRPELGIKQGSSDEVNNWSNFYSSLTDAHLKAAVGLYNRMIEVGIAPEEARMILPQNMYTEFYETASLAAYLRIIELRADRHAQRYIRKYAKAVLSIISELFPETIKAYNNITEVTFNEADS